MSPMTLLCVHTSILLCMCLLSSAMSYLTQFTLSQIYTMFLFVTCLPGTVCVQQCCAKLHEYIEMCTCTVHKLLLSVQRI